VANGGKLLIMDSPSNINSTAMWLLSLWGLSFPEDNKTNDPHLNLAHPSQPDLSHINLSDQTTSHTIFTGMNIKNNLFIKSFKSVIQGDALLVNANRESVLSSINYGEGKVIVFGASHLFNDATMGETSVIPNEYQWKLSNLEFKIIEMLGEGKK
jgi:hypothetical protein